MEAYTFLKDAWHDLLPLRQKISELATRWRALKADCSSGKTSSPLQTNLTLNSKWLFPRFGAVGDKRGKLGHTGVTDLKGLQEYDMQFNLTQSTGARGTLWVVMGRYHMVQAWNKPGQKPLALT